MALTAEQRHAARAAGIRKAKAEMTQAQKIHQLFSTGRPPASELRTAAEAITSAKVLLRELQAAMTQAKLNTADCVVRIAFVSPDFSMAFTRKFVPGHESLLLKELSEQPVIMIGLLFGILDREDDSRENNVIVGIKPFLVTKQVVGWLQDLAEQSHNGLN